MRINPVPEFFPRRLPALLAAMMLLCLLCTGTPCADRDIADARTLGRAFASVARKVRPAVVAIRTEIQLSGPDAYTFNDPFLLFNDEFARRFFQMRRPRQPRVSEGMGSGFIIAHDGYIITNTHVIKGASKIIVKTHDGQEFFAQVVGSDEKSDVALLKIETVSLPFLELGDSGAIEVGEWVLAIGNPFGLSQTVTGGIVSATGRNSIGILDYEDFIQTDAAINPGNSGGPLVNLSGEVVGLNTAIFSKSGGYMGIGFAIPANAVRHIYRQLRNHGRFTPGYLGAVVRELSAPERAALPRGVAGGTLVTSVQNGSPAENGGLRRDDIITGIDGKPVSDAAAFNNATSMLGAGESVRLDFLRRGTPMNRVVILQPSVEPPRETQSNLGIWVRDLSTEERQRLRNPVLSGAVVTKIAPSSPAEFLGLRAGTLIIKVNGIDTPDAATLRSVLPPALGRGTLELIVLQDGAVRRLIFRN